MAMNEEFKIRGVTNKQELKPKDTWRDTRTSWQKFSDLLLDKTYCYAFLFSFIILMIMIPIFAEFIFIIGFLFFLKISMKKITLPFRYPMSSKMMDYVNLNTEGKPVPADGISFIGNEKGTNKELWFSNSDMRTHLLVFGTTGAGKALRKDEFIYTPNGLVKNKDLRVGSEIIKHDGEIGKVLGIYDQGYKSLYEIKFNDGRSVKVSKDHLWEIYEYIENINDVKYRQPEVITTLEIFNRLEDYKKTTNQDPDKQISIGILPVNDIDFVGKKVFTLQHINKIVYENIRNFIKKEKYNIDLENIVLDGTLNQRKIFWYEYFKLIKQQSDIVNLFMGQIVIKFYNKEYALIIQNLLWSLGYWCKLEELNNLPVLNNPEDGYVCGLMIQQKNFLKIDEVVITKESEECQCIKIDDERGLFVIDNYIVTHNTEALISIAYNSLVQGSGFIYVDGKGDVSLWAKILYIVRTLGREDDLLVLNYMTGGRDVLGPQVTKVSNTLNPLTSGTSGGLTELIVGLMGSNNGGDDMWKGRAISLVSSVMRALVWKRDYEYFLLDVEKLRDSLVLKEIYKLSQSPTLPQKIKNSLNAYLLSLPGYKDTTKIEEQTDTVMEQHGYLQMQFTRVLSSLSDDYGHIFQTNLGEIDFNDVVINRRILCVLLPALEKSSDELSNLGKIVIGCIKSMMSKGLGDSLEGEYRDIVETRPTNSPVPYTCILDEYGYYSVKGAAVIPAQARSLGFCMIFAGQDLPAFKKNGNAEEAISIMGNCNIKIFMKLEDAADTYEVFVKSVGEAAVQKLSSKNKNTGMFGNSYVDPDNLNIVKEKRGDLLDLKDQENGEAHILFKSQIVRARLFYANPQKIKQLQVNNFIKVEPPNEIQIEKIKSDEENAINVTNNNFNINQILIANEEKRHNVVKLWKNLNDIFIDKKLSKKDSRKALFGSLFSLENNINSGNLFKMNSYEDEEFDIDSVEKISTFRFEEIDPDYESKLKGIEANFTPERAKINEKVKQTIKDMENVAQYPKEGVPIPVSTNYNEIEKQMVDFLDKID